MPVRRGHIKRHKKRGRIKPTSYFFTLAAGHYFSWHGKVIKTRSVIFSDRSKHWDRAFSYNACLKDTAQ